MFRKENGVTLVALVITIIVLLILAGVTISMVLGDDGIIGNAKNAATNTEAEDIKNAMQLASLTVRTDVIAKESGNPRTGGYTEYSATNLVTAFNANSDFTATKVSDTSITVAGDSLTYTFTVTADSNKVEFTNSAATVTQ